MQFSTMTHRKHLINDSYCDYNYILIIIFIFTILIGIQHISIKWLNKGKATENIWYFLSFVKEQIITYSEKGSCSDTQAAVQWHPHNSL